MYFIKQKTVWLWSVAESYWSVILPFTKVITGYSKRIWKHACQISAYYRNQRWKNRKNIYPSVQAITENQKTGKEFSQIGTFETTGIASVVFWFLNYFSHLLQTQLYHGIVTGIILHPDFTEMEWSKDQYRINWFYWLYQPDGREWIRIWSLSLKQTWIACIPIRSMSFTLSSINVFQVNNRAGRLCYSFMIE